MATKEEGGLMKDQHFLPYVSHSPTSKSAALAKAPTAGSDEERVLVYIRARGAYGATDEEAQEHLALNPSTQRPRRVALVAKGLIADSGNKRLTRSKRQAVVWTAKGDEK